MRCERNGREPQGRGVYNPNTITDGLWIGMIVHNGEIDRAVVVRVYRKGPGATRTYAECSYCCDGFHAGTGWAGGGGYDKAAAAASQAIESAGLQLLADSGRAEFLTSVSEIPEATRAITRAVARWRGVKPDSVSVIDPIF